MATGSRTHPEATPAETGPNLRLALSGEQQFHPNSPTLGAPPPHGGALCISYPGGSVMAGQVTLKRLTNGLHLRVSKARVYRYGEPSGHNQVTSGYGGVP